LRGLTHESSKVRPGFVGAQSTRVIMGEAQDYPTFMWGPRKIGPNPKSGLQCGLEVEFTSVIFFFGEIGLAVFKIILYFPTKIHFLGQPKNYRFFFVSAKTFYVLMGTYKNFSYVFFLTPCGSKNNRRYSKENDKIFCYVIFLLDGKVEASE